MSNSPYENSDVGIFEDYQGPDNPNVKPMRCPICKSVIVEWKKLRLETLDIHIACPDEIPYSMAYRCGNGQCPSNNGARSTDEKPLVFWSEDGERFGMGNGLTFIDNNDAPFGSISRKINVEVYKKDENKKLCTLPLWFPSVLSGMTIRTKWNYQADEDGKILKRRLGFDYLTKEGVYHNWGIHMLSYCLRCTFKEWRRVKKDPENRWALDHLKQTIRQKSWQGKEWWRNVNIFFAEMAVKNLENNA